MSDRGARRIRLAVIMLAAALLWGCEGDDGSQGPPGPRGDQGDRGDPGDPGPTGSGGGVPVESAEKINIEVTSVTVPAGGGAPVVELKLTNDLTQGLKGLPANEIRFLLAQLSPAPAGSGESSQWQNYITTDDAGVPDVQATAERAQNGTFVDNGDGTYQYTFAMALTDYSAGPTFDETKTHRLGIEIRNDTPLANNGIFDFVPNGAPITFERKIVDNDTCNACHDVLNFHGGPRTDVEYCVTCHNPSSTDANSGNSVDMKRLIHNIHYGRNGFVIFGFRDSEHDYTDVRWTQDPRNCTTCHEENDANTPQASNWRLVPNRQACGTCHYDDGIAGNTDDEPTSEYAIEDGVHPGGFVFSDDTQCVDCHGPDGTVTNSEGQLVVVSEIHRIPALEASDDFVFNIVDVRNVVAGGAPLEIDYSVTDPAGTPYDLDNDPAFTNCGNRASRLSIDIAWTTDDYTNAGAGTANARPLEVNALSAAAGCGGGADPDGDGVYTATASSGLPAALSGTIGVALEGHPAADFDGDGTFSDRVAVTNAIAYFGIDGADPVPRRGEEDNPVVNIQNCDDCHKQLALHGDNRTDKPEVCAMCHNPNATDINRRVADTDCTNILGSNVDANGFDDADVEIDFKRMVHRIHAGNVGVCGFGNSAHPYFDVVYPGRLNNCEGCHVGGTYYPVEPGTILGTTIDANDPTTPTDDLVISPNTSVCSSCHTSSLAAEHMKQNGGDFEATKAADSSLISSGVETCLLCHGPGRTADVAEMHGVGEFDFNR